MSLQDLFEQEKEHVTDVGKAYLCERVVMHGKDLHHQLGDKDWFDLYVFSITRRQLNKKQLQMLNFMWACTSYPDPSIWPNHVTEIAANARTTPSLSLMSGLAISEATIYGRRPERRAIDFLHRARRLVEEGQSIEEVIEKELSKHKVIFGYGRPLAKMDERVILTVRKAKELGFETGVHYRLAIEIYLYLKKNKGLSMNVAALDAGICADFGFSSEQYQLLLSPAFLAGMIPCYLDGKQKPEGTVFAMRCDSVIYSGPEKRPW